MSAWRIGLSRAEQLQRPLALAQQRRRQHHPCGGVRVLPAVLADARHVALDVAGLQRSAIERWREQQDHLIRIADQTILDRRHRLAGPLRIAGAGDHRPRLGDRIDLALVVLRRAERSAIIEVRPTVPAAVPGVLLQCSPQRLGSLPAPGRPRGVAALLGQAGELAQGRQHEPAVPDALALALGADLVHAVVPVAGAHQRQAVRPELQAVLQRSHAVLVHRPGHVAHFGEAVILLLFGLQDRRRAGTAPARPAEPRRRWCAT